MADTKVNRGSTYTCSACGETYTAEWSEAEAAAEAQANFGSSEPTDMAVVCDDCYQAMARRYGWKGAAS